jgi:hypothetical protein
LNHPLSEEQLAHFWTHGFVAMPGLFTAAEARAFQDEAERLSRETPRDALNLRVAFAKVGAGSATDNKVLWKIDPFHDLSRLFADMVQDRRICDALASIYDGREPRLFKDKLIYKPPHTRAHGLHQDYNWWQGFPTSLISVVIAVDGADTSNGCTIVYPGYERGFLTEPGQIGTLSREQIQADQAVACASNPGDVLLFHCFTPHEAGPNTSDRFRRQIFLTYNDSADGEHYRAHYEHYVQYMKADTDSARAAALYLR